MCLPENIKKLSKLTGKGAEIELYALSSQTQNYNKIEHKILQPQLKLLHIQIYSVPHSI